MSDTPLFQNADEQEEIYAPQQLPQHDHSTTGVAVVPTTAGAFNPADVAPGTATETSPVIGAAALAEETEKDNQEEREP